MGLAYNKLITSLLLLVTLFSSSPDLVSSMSSSTSCPSETPTTTIKGAYWPSWLFSTYPPSSIRTSLFTHIFYAFVEPHPTTYQLVISKDDDTMLSNFTTTLRTRHPPVKTLLSLGGGGSRGPFGELARTPSTRSAFITSTISVARKYNLDGLDLDWEFPADPTEMENLGLLYTDWRAAIDKEAEETGREPLLLTSAVYFASHFFLSGTPRSFPVETMRDTVDFINVMCYDYHGSWDTSATGAHAALYDPTSNISSSYGIPSWIQAGMPPEKMVMGLPLYGRSWKLKDPSNHGVGSPAVGIGPGDAGTITYTKLMDFNKENHAVEVYDKKTVSMYSYAGASWIGYDGPVSVAAKIGYARGMKLGGYFFWALGYDKDWSISCTASSAWRNY